MNWHYLVDLLLPSHSQIDTQKAWSSGHSDHSAILSLHSLCDALLVGVTTQRWKLEHCNFSEKNGRKKQVRFFFFKLRRVLVFLERKKRHPTHIQIEVESTIAQKIVFIPRFQSLRIIPTGVSPFAPRYRRPDWHMAWKQRWDTTLLQPPPQPHLWDVR